MPSKFYKLLLLTVMITFFSCIFIQPAFATYTYEECYDKSWDSPAEGTYVTIHSTKTGKYVSRVKYNHSYWIPLREIFAPHIESVNWEHKNKIAYLQNDDKVLVFNFSGQELEINSNQFLVPSKHAKMIDGKTYVDGLWVGWLFDRNADSAITGDDPTRQSLEKELSFLNISATDMIDATTKDGCLHLAIYFNDI
ncbi:MAG: hypothetical protein PHN47_05710 [Clostridia bacterium]|jgi:hypothetical protein|nr:hypothetical protein [Clostridia bacterium]